MSAVLVVEDEQHLADGLRFNLEAEGYTVNTVGDGEAALALLVDEKQRYDVLVLDVMLPGKNGFAVAVGTSRGRSVCSDPHVDSSWASGRCTARLRSRR